MKRIKIQKFLHKHGNVFLLALTSGTLVALLTSLTASWEYIVLTGWDCAIVVLFCLVIYSSYPMDQGRHTKKVILKEGIRYPLIDAFVVFSSAVSVFIVILLLTISKGSRLEIVLCIFSVFSSWNLIQLLYAIHYSEIYYQNNGGVSFNAKGLPNFWDFLYLAYTIGMTYQVSDTNFSTTRFRKVALGHSLISFAFSTLLIATMINFIASLISSH